MHLTKSAVICAARVGGAAPAICLHKSREIHQRCNATLVHETTEPKFHLPHDTHINNESYFHAPAQPRAKSKECTSGRINVLHTFIPGLVLNKPCFHPMSPLNCALVFEIQVLRPRLWVLGFCCKNSSGCSS